MLTTKPERNSHASTPLPNAPTDLDALTNTVVAGDCRDILTTLPPESLDLVFADPPYFLQLKKELFRPDHSKVNGVHALWDRYDSFASYDTFTADWLRAVHPLLKPNASIWISGTYHNIFRIGKILQDLGYWILNDVIWIKHNPMPNFLGRRLTNAHETLIWAAKSQDAPYHFHYHVAKAFNDDLQLRSDWYLPICSGKERLRDQKGKTAHPTQKPQALLNRIMQLCTEPGALVLDPFCGSGTTPAVAKLLHRRYIGIEQDPSYCALARKRIDAVVPLPDADLLASGAGPARKERLPFSRLYDMGLLQAGDILFNQKQTVSAKMTTTGSLIIVSCAQQDLIGKTGSIHKIAALVNGSESCNGWQYWYVRIPSKQLNASTLRPNQPLQTVLLDTLRQHAITLNKRQARQSFDATTL